MSYGFLLDIALILLGTKLLGILTKRFSMPQVVGALIAGLILGPACLNILHETDFLKSLSELGVIVLMFSAGLETDIHELKKTGKSSLVIALFGVFLPLIGGFAIAALFNKDAGSLLQNIFIGVILTATSVSITVETLKELGKLSTKAGNAILGAALIDDILGIVALTVITSVADTSVNIWLVLLKIVMFFVFAGAIGVLFYKFFSWWVARAKQDMRRFVVVSFAFCLVMSYVSEHFFGVADITGAFIAGLIISNCERTKYISSRFSTMSYLLLSPIFFASIGITVSIPPMTTSIILFSILLLIIAVLTKIIGCGIGAKICGYTNREAMQVGSGMVSRGEVALIVASKGQALGLMNALYFGPIVIMIVVTTIITPILLKFVFSSKKGEHDEDIVSELVENYTEAENLELVDQQLVQLHTKLKKEAQEKNKE